MKQSRETIGNLFVNLAFNETKQEHYRNKLFQVFLHKKSVTKSRPFLLYTRDTLKNSDNVKVYQSPMLLENR